MKAEDIQLYGSRVLIKPLKEVKFKVKENRPKVTIPLAKDGVDLDNPPSTDEVEVVEVEVVSSIQLGKVVAIGDDKNIPCSVGDIVYYHLKATVPFELMNRENIQMIKYFDIIGYKQIGV